MADVAALVAGAAVAFAATNVDDLVILALLFGAGRAARGPRGRDVVIGQYLGMAVLTLTGVAGALGAQLLPDHAVALLGLVPLALGIRALLGLRGDDEPPPVLPASAGWLGVAGLTVANGADNVAVYVPFFAQADTGGLALICVVFAVLVGVWCVLARAVGTHPVVVRAIERAGHVIVPVVLIVLGAVIVLSGTIG